ncbi:FAD-dependent oxidoreductase [Bacillus sp. DJP31]|uniref:FAD-dependent oxidoreductase n=1 Tax=Bacillus sp. DJP31 TaxID=3409789 RepID=UPI003BB74C6A
MYTIKTVILIGAGHAHLYCLKMVEKANLNDIKFILISPSPYQYYSGMFSGYTEGIYSIDDIRIDVRQLSKHSSFEFVEDHVIKVSPVSKYVECSKGHNIQFDVISFDIGSIGEKPSSFSKEIFPIKPTYMFSDSVNLLREKENPIIVGGGASGFELALAIKAFQLTQRKLNATVTLVSSKQLLSGYNDKISKTTKEIAIRKGVIIHENEPVIDVFDSKIITKSGLTLSYDGLLWLTGPKAPLLFKHSNLTVNETGYLVTNRFLQSVQYPYIFGAGDCVSLVEYPTLPKNGVNAIRQSPILWRNILSYLKEMLLVPFQPQKNYLSILSTGQKQGLLLYNNFYFHHKSAWLLKNRIDRRFIRKYKK